MERTIFLGFWRGPCVHWRRLAWGDYTLKVKVINWKETWSTSCPLQCIILGAVLLSPLKPFLTYWLHLVFWDFKLATNKENLYEEVSNKPFQVYYPAGSTSPGQSPRGGLGLYASPIDLVVHFFCTYIALLLIPSMRDPLTWWSIFFCTLCFFLHTWLYIHQPHIPSYDLIKDFLFA